MSDDSDDEFGYIGKKNFKSKEDAQENWKQFAEINGITKWEVV